MTEPLIHVALLHPEIPGNTGSVGRTCVAVGARLHLVRPLGFDTDERAVRRAGIDHWKLVDVVEHEAPAFWAWADARRVHLFSAHGGPSYTGIAWAPQDVLVFGCESVGLPRDLVAARGAWRIPTPGPVRSLNLSNAVAVVVYDALRSLRPEVFHP